MPKYRNKKRPKRVVDAIEFKGRPDVEPNELGYYDLDRGMSAKKGDFIVDPPGNAWYVMSAEAFLAKFEQVDAPAPKKKAPPKPPAPEAKGSEGKKAPAKKKAAKKKAPAKKAKAKKKKGRR